MPMCRAVGPYFSGKILVNLPFWGQIYVFLSEISLKSSKIPEIRENFLEIQEFREKFQYFSES